MKTGCQKADATCDRRAVNSRRMGEGGTRKKIAQAMKGQGQHPTAKYGRRTASREINGENVEVDGPDGKAWILKDRMRRTKETTKETAGRLWETSLPKADVLFTRMEARIRATRGKKGKQAVKRRAQHPRPRQGIGIHQERRKGMEHKKGDIRKRRWPKEGKTLDKRKQASRR